MPKVKHVYDQSVYDAARYSKTHSIKIKIQEIELKMEDGEPIMQITYTSAED